ncbi:MAG: hypothetical protein Q4D36_00240 [Bacteroidales bacterium]|nr:hypothetical protein [Bacteroidales bacterium]
MKKIKRTFVIAYCASMFIACGNSKTPDKAQEEEVQMEESVAEDSLGTDTTEVARGDTQGFGRCGQSGCKCKEFEGRGETCRNCGHAYRTHY